MKEKRILVPNGNYTDIPLIKQFKKMGLYVITSGNNPNLEGHKYADEYVGHDYSDYKGMLELAKKLRIDYVSACSNDFGVTTASYIAEKLGLPGHDSFVAAKTIAEKDLFKKFGKENNLQIIPSNQFDNEEEAIAFAKSCSYPIIVKPTDLGGGKGVSKIDTDCDAADAIKTAINKSRKHHIVIEPYIEGTQHSFTCFICDEKVLTYSSYNEFDSQYNKFLVGYASSPAKGIKEIAPCMIDQTEKMAKLLKLKDGIFHIQYRIHDGKPLIMECMRRCLGNYALMAAGDSVGFQWEEWIARAYCGMNCSGIPRNEGNENYILEYYIQAHHNGIFRNIKMDSELTKYTIREIMNIKPGEEITDYKTQILGFVFFKFPDSDTLSEAENSINNKFQVVME